MTTPRPLHHLVLVAGLLGLLLGGCSVLPEAQVDPTRYYVLAGAAPAEVGAPAPASALILGLKPVQLPPYLEKISVAVRHGTNELVYNDYARWAEPLDAGIARVLRARLIASPAVSRVFAAPFPFDQARDYDIAVSVIRCEGAQAGGRSVARFAAVMEITTGGESSRLVARRVFTAPERAWDGKDYGALVQALSEDVGDLCTEVVGALPAAGK
jgi:uncharacterized lipoprotein YmbA